LRWAVRARCRSFFWAPLIFVLLVPRQRLNALGPNDRRLTSSRTGVSVEAPGGWTLSQHTGYADTMVLFIHPDGSRISVTAAPTEVATPDALLLQNRPGLIAQGLVPAPAVPGIRGSLAVDLGATGRSEKLRQLYLVRDVPLGHQAIILTLVAPLRSFADRTAALDFVASRLSLDDPSSSSDSKRVPGRAPGAGGGRAGP
jgi:hypothetical protein